MTVETKIEASLSSAMAAAFGEIEGATKSANNPHFKTKYADLTTVIEAIKPALIKHGLFFTQRPEPSEKGVTIETVIGHSSGEEMSLGKLFVPANKQDAQSFGSALTYARRYALVTAFGVPVEDDDGNAASNRQQASDSGPARDNSEARQVSPTGPANPSPAGMPDAEFAKLVQLIEATKTDPGVMIKYYGVENLRLLNKTQYAGAVESLNIRLAAMAKAGTNNAAGGFGEILNDKIVY